MHIDGTSLAPKRHFRGLLDELETELVTAFFVHGQGNGKMDGREFISLIKSIEDSLSVLKTGRNHQTAALPASSAK